MAKRQRLDKLLSHMGYGSRTEVKKLIKQGRVEVNHRAADDGGLTIDPDADHVLVDGERVVYREFIYLMLHKPQGVVSATEDNRDRTVLDLLSAKDRHYEPFPVGRLDKDTEGLLLLTNDGQLAHNLLSPRKHVNKTYYARVRGEVGQEDVEAFSRGVELDDGYVTLPASLVVRQIEQNGSDEVPMSRIELTIQEGKFHQVKRMFEAVGKKVVYLKRLSMGPLVLDEQLPLGKYRELLPEELQALLAHRGEAHE